MGSTPRPDNRRKRTEDSTVKQKPKVDVGEPFTETDIQLSGSSDIEQRTKARSTTILVVAVVAFYSLYMAHEWWANKSFDGIGRFLENALAMFIGWVVGKNYHNRGDP
jgi:hypothetical protein